MKFLVILSMTMFSSGSINLIYLSTVIHGFSKTQKQGFITESLRLLKSNGLLVILEMKKEPMSFGPPQDIRLSPEDLKNIIPLKSIRTIDLNPYFYIQIFKKENL